MRANPKPDVNDHRGDLVPVVARTVALVYVPFMQAIFQTEALPMDDLLLLLALAASSFTLHESRRRYERTLNQRETYVTAMEELA
jgi:Ca2+-transporting ATPase